MKKDLISRQKLRMALYHEAFELDSDEQRWDGGCWIRYKMFERVVESMPTESERERGKWIWDDEGHHCSECFYHPQGLTLEIMTGEYHFCPNCGAEMEAADD